MKQLSSCHKAPVNTVTGDEGTSHWICSRCNKPCNLWLSTTARVTKAKQSLEDELIKKTLDTILNPANSRKLGYGAIKQAFTQVRQDAKSNILGKLLARIEESGDMSMVDDVVDIVKSLEESK